MEVKFIQVEEKKKCQISLIRNEIEFRNCPAPPKFFSEDIYNRPVSPIPERRPYLPPPRSPSPDFELIRAALHPAPSRSRPSPPRRSPPRSRIRSPSPPRRKQTRSRSRSRSRDRNRRRRRSHGRTEFKKIDFC